MVQLIFVGSETIVGTQRFQRLGDKAQFKTAEDAADAVRGGGQFITPEEFASCKFTDVELKRYVYAGPRVTAPAEFHAKLQTAHEYFRNRCNSLREQQASLEAAETAKQLPVEQVESDESYEASAALIGAADQTEVTE